MPTPRRRPQSAPPRRADRPTGAPARARTRAAQPPRPRPPAPRGYSAARVRELPLPHAPNDPADETW